ncbi:hypothetical protein [Kiloniella majae]|uniref:hypothetical protein n=1 Tax=Kiloniella majae TaxID=1938558 RepID=UPI000A278F57|nr:hypothetical protein [Kiloniella majae]
MPEKKKQSKKPNSKQLEWLQRGLDQAGGKLPLFDEHGQHYDVRLIRACIDHGWAEPWFSNALKPDWIVCKLTKKGRDFCTSTPHPSPRSSGRVSAS